MKVKNTIRLLLLALMVFLPARHLLFAENSFGITDLARRLEAHVSFLASDSLEGRGLGTEGKIIAKHYIAEEFGSIGLQPPGDDYFQHMDLRIGLARVPATNVVGYLPGSDPVLKDEFIVIGAHYDHLGYEYRNGERIIYPGADDNASGTAAMIELARHFAGNPGTFGRSIIFIAFDAEESGLLGAERFLQDIEYFDTEKIRMMFSLDMVGMYEANNGLHLRGIGTLEGGIDLAREVAVLHGLDLSRVTSEIEARTDTRPFGEAGIPAAQAFTGLKSPYHKPGDRYELLDYDGMALITDYLGTLVAEMSVMPDLMPSARFARHMSPWGIRLHSGVLAHLGSTHHRYPDEFFQADGLFAFATGLFFRMQFGQKFALQSELLYDFNGSQSQWGKYRQHSLTLPLNLHLYMAGDDGGLVRAYPIAGGYFRHSFAGSDEGIGPDFGNFHPSQEWGLNFGFGMEVMKVQVAYTWRIGLTDISNIQGTRVYNTGGYFTMGYRF
ncbi:MAG: M20/M25/M40 family metallo-hydrolase [Marinilabiliales bacterium]|nr:MAG: M20/M25/M40 family metallo-hydrolase [Marinilabiliales bacterium]